MKITTKTIEYVAALSKLTLSNEEEEKAIIDLSNILEYMEIMNELNTDDIEPMSHTLDIHNVFRDDVVTNGVGQEVLKASSESAEADRDDLLANAPAKKDNCFIVPKTVE